MSTEISDTFDCFGSSCTVIVAGDGPQRPAADGLSHARERLLSWHERFSRFLATSELSRLNADPRRLVQVSPLMARLAGAVHAAGALSGGLVDGTLGAEVLAAGYASDIERPLPLAGALALAPTRAPAGPAPTAAWRGLAVDLERGTLSREPGIQLDSGGLAKGLFADVLAASLAAHGSFVVNCAGDLALGGSDRLTRFVHVESPFDGRTLHTFQIGAGGVATSGIGRRAWLDGEGRPAHHLIDPATGRPAFTGVVQVTALADTALGAEVRAKAALLSGPPGAAHWLPQGGVIVFDDGTHQVIAPPPTVSLEQLSAYARRRPTRVVEHV